MLTVDGWCWLTAWGSTGPRSKPISLGSGYAGLGTVSKRHFPCHDNSDNTRRTICLVQRKNTTSYSGINTLDSNPSTQPTRSCVARNPSHNRFDKPQLFLNSAVNFEISTT